MKRFSAMLVILWLGAAGAAAARDGLPGYYPDSFDRVGTIDRLDLHGGQAVINDVLFTLPEDTRVHTATARFATLNALRQGMTVGVRLSATAPGLRPIAEIWVLNATPGGRLHRGAPRRGH